ncbi:MAG: HD domain-containing phosphohydrolase [Phycisphaerales bacterium]
MSIARPKETGGEPRGESALSGASSRLSSSARSGYIPIPLERSPAGAFDQISIYLRGSEGFALYRGSTYRFNEADRKRLISRNVHFVYIHIDDQQRLRRNIENNLAAIARDPAIAVSERSAILYETSVQLIDELLAEADLDGAIPRIRRVSHAVTTLVMNEPAAFSHLFAASNHDFYTATHMVNVSTWMVALAYAMGHRDADELAHICEAGLLHDIGKMFIPEEVLNKKETLTPSEWAQIKGHAAKGREHLEGFAGMNEIVLEVTHHHHERLDGSGYPDGLRGDEIPPITRIAAVVDSFDAMTAIRPFKANVMSVDDAIKTLQRETPSKYDPDVVQAWLGLIRRVEAPKIEAPEVSMNDSDSDNRRAFERFAYQCPARVYRVGDNGEAVKGPAIPATTHNISRSGLGFLSQYRIELDEEIRIHLMVPNGDERVLQGLTVRSRPYTDGWYDVGVRFGSDEEKPATAA